MAGSLQVQTKQFVTKQETRQTNRRALRFNVFAFSVLFVGHLLTTGTGVIESDIAKIAFRFVYFLIFLINIIGSGTIRLQYVVSFFFAFVNFTLNQSQVAVSVVFLLMNLCNLYEEVTVLHHGSSTHKYFSHPSLSFEVV